MLLIYVQLDSRKVAQPRCTLVFPPSPTAVDWWPFSIDKQTQVWRRPWTQYILALLL